MKKIIMLAVMLASFMSVQAFGACKLEDLGACKANLDNQPQTIKDKLLPNHIDQMINPTRDSSKEFTNAPHTIPETINMDVDDNPSNQETGNTPYNSSCQFGTCLPGNSPGISGD